MTAEDYIKQRVDDQLHWYSGKSSRAKKMFLTLRSVEIVFAALIPVATAFSESIPGGKLVPALLGAAIAAVAALVSLGHFQENWVSYRTTCESLKREKFMFETGAEPYTGSDSFKNFVARVEELLSKESRSWAGVVQSTSEKTEVEKSSGAVA